MSTPLRSLTKTVTYRLTGSMMTAGIIYLVTGKYDIAVGAGFIDVSSKLFFYYIHERIWDKIKWGRYEFQTPPTSEQPGPLREHCLEGGIDNPEVSSGMKHLIVITSEQPK